MITQDAFGVVDGLPAHSYLVDGGDGVTLKLTDFGARLVELSVPGRDDHVADVVLGFDNAQAYADSSTYFGATVGRYGNRIRGGAFTLMGRDYLVDRNEGANHLHGGRDGWDSRVWDVDLDGDRVIFRTTSSDGEMGFPGACDIRSAYELHGRTLRITMEATPTQTTVINMVHHSYFNLAGHAGGDVLSQHMRLPSDFYVPVDDELLATGEILTVDGTAYDFRELRPIGARMQTRGGYDHNWCLRADSAELTEAAEIYDPGSGRRLRLWTSEPGVQMYTGGYLNDQVVGKGGSRYCAFAGFTLETQKFPDSPRFAHFPTTTVHAGALYRHEMLFEFTAD